MNFSSIRLLTPFCIWLTAARSFSPKRSIVRFSRVKASGAAISPSSSGRSARDASSLFPLSPFLATASCRASASSSSRASASVPACGTGASLAGGMTTSCILP